MAAVTCELTPRTMPDKLLQFRIIVRTASSGDKTGTFYKVVADETEQEPWKVLTFPAAPSRCYRPSHSSLATLGNQHGVSRHTSNRSANGRKIRRFCIDFQQWSNENIQLELKVLLEHDQCQKVTRMSISCSSQ